MVDENLDPKTVEFLRAFDHEAVNVEESLGKGSTDRSVTEQAQADEALILTNDSDFLRPAQRQDLMVLYVPENTLDAHDIASRVDALAELVPNQSDLSAVTWLSERG